jgi:hypothetical protein
MFLLLLWVCSSSRCVARYATTIHGTFFLKNLGCIYSLLSLQVTYLDKVRSNHQNVVNCILSLEEKILSQYHLKNHKHILIEIGLLQRQCLIQNVKKCGWREYIVYNLLSCIWQPISGITQRGNQSGFQFLLRLLSLAADRLIRTNGYTLTGQLQLLN